MNLTSNVSGVNRHQASRSHWWNHHLSASLPGYFHHSTGERLQCQTTMERRSFTTTTTFPCKILTEISARLPNLGGQKLAKILAEISKSWRPKPCRDLKTLAAKNSPRISARFQVRSRRDGNVSAVQNLLRILVRLAETPRYQNLGT